MGVLTGVYLQVWVPQMYYFGVWFCHLKDQEMNRRREMPNFPVFLMVPACVVSDFAQFQIIKSSQSAHERESSLDSLDKDGE